MIGLSRMISISARAGIDLYTIVDQLNSTGNCPSYSVRRATRGDTSRGSCCPMAVGNASWICSTKSERTASDGVCRQRPYTGQKDTGPAESRKESHR